LHGAAAADDFQAKSLMEYEADMKVWFIAIHESLVCLHPNDTAF
jgi:hypothetical protein